MTTSEMTRIASAASLLNNVLRVDLDDDPVRLNFIDGRAVIWIVPQNRVINSEDASEVLAELSAA